MKIRYIKYFFTAVVIFIICLSGCTEQGPTLPDGSGHLILTAINKEGILNSDSTPVYLRNAQVILSSVYGTKIYYTDNKGQLDINNLPVACYDVAVIYQNKNFSKYTFSAALKNVKVQAEKVIEDTLKTIARTSGGIVINEIFCSGSPGNYYFDQFIELYNNSDEIKYLDGMIIFKSLGKAAGNGDALEVTSKAMFKFPGNPGENNYPFQPKKFAVLAATACDHRKICSSSIDLSNANWEFYNAYDKNECDYPAKNLINCNPSYSGRYLFYSASGCIILADGRDINANDGIDISTIIDGVEYKASLSAVKNLDNRVDQNYMISPPSYSGKSMQRRNAGWDTDNARLDWEIISHPTPGYQ